MNCVCELEAPHFFRRGTFLIMELRGKEKPDTFQQDQVEFSLNLLEVREADYKPGGWWCCAQAKKQVTDHTFVCECDFSQAAEPCVCVCVCSLSQHTSFTSDGSMQRLCAWTHSLLNWVIKMHVHVDQASPSCLWPPLSGVFFKAFSKNKPHAL